MADTQVTDAGPQEFTIPLGLLRLSQRRHDIATELVKRAWFRGTTPAIQHQLLTLPEDPAHRNDWSGLLENLATHPDTIGGVTKLRMSMFLAGNFAAVMVFDVVNDEGMFYSYELVSWKFGPKSGAKGIVFVRTNGKITHFVVLRGEKFATGKLEYDLTGGFSDGSLTLNKLIETEVQEELGALDLEVSEIIDLGVHTVDPGMTNNEPGLFAAVIDAGQVAKISRKPINLDGLELRMGAIVLPIRQLGDFFQDNSDSFFRAAIGMAVNQGVIAHRYMAARNRKFWNGPRAR